MSLVKNFESIIKNGSRYFIKYQNNTNTITWEAEAEGGI